MYIIGGMDDFSEEEIPLMCRFGVEQIDPTPKPSGLHEVNRQGREDALHSSSGSEQNASHLFTFAHTGAEINPMNH